MDNTRHELDHWRRELGSKPHNGPASLPGDSFPRAVHEAQVQAEQGSRTELKRQRSEFRAVQAAGIFKAIAPGGNCAERASQSVCEGCLQVHC